MSPKRESPSRRQPRRAEFSGDDVPPTHSKSPAHLQDDAAWSTADAAWFAVHPDRTYRLRAAMDGELANLAEEIGVDPGLRPVGTRLWIISRRPGQGGPSRYPHLEWSSGPTLAERPDFEPMLRAFFECGFDALRRGAPGIDAYVLMDRLVHPIGRGVV